MAFRKLGWLMVALAPVVMTGCGSKTEPSKSNLGLRGSVWVQSGVFG